MKLKMNEEGNVVVQDGKPVYVYDDGKEVPFDADSAVRRIANLTDEKDRHFKSAQALKQELEKFSGIEDPAEALEAMKTVQNFKDKEMVDAGEVEKLKSGLAEMFEKEKKQLTENFTKDRDELSKSLGEKEGVIRRLMVNNRFATSPWFSGESPKTILPPDMAAEYFGKYFKVEGEGSDLRVVGYINGDKILSRERIGETAGFDEALSEIINNYPQKDRILAGSQGGSGSSGNTGGGADTISRAALNRLSPAERMQAALQKTVVD